MASPNKHTNTVRRHKRAMAGKPRKAAIRRAIRKAVAQKIDVL
jgi:hypothetical protein